MSPGFAHAPKGRRIPAQGEPWEQRPTCLSVLKERRISGNAARVPDPPICGVPSERIRVPGASRVSPFVGMQRPVGSRAR